MKHPAQFASQTQLSTPGGTSLLALSPSDPGNVDTRSDSAISGQGKSKLSVAEPPDIKITTAM